MKASLAGDAWRSVQLVVKENVTSSSPIRVWIFIWYSLVLLTTVLLTGAHDSPSAETPTISVPKPVRTGGVLLLYYKPLLPPYASVAT